MLFYKTLTYLLISFIICDNKITNITPSSSKDIIPNPNIFNNVKDPRNINPIPQQNIPLTENINEEIPTHKLAEKPPISFNENGKKRTGFFLHPNITSGETPNLSIDPRCEIVEINGKKSQLCPNELYNELNMKQKDKKLKKNLPELSYKLTDLFKENPEISENLEKIMIDDKLQLWNQISDIDSKQQHKLPSTKGLFNRARDKLNILTAVKESLSQELITTEKLVKRVKSYLDENRETLQRNLPIMKDILQKLPSVHDSVMQNDLAQRYVRLHKEEMEIMELYNIEKDWLVEVLSLFGSLFALT